ncbi:MAG: hypothetical protein IT477_07280, partial [Rhodanobacteraceae bacterium]|nr:hypothetical protein [Rhodanobacteraceae bacterium]
MAKASEVFGISRDLPLNYVERRSADNKLVDNLTRDKHLVIFGSSKQGKTSLRKHALNEEDAVVVHCSNKWSIADIHSAILKKVGFELTQSTSKTTAGKSKIFAKISATIFGGGAEGGAETEREEASTATKAPLELDPEDVNDIILALHSVGFDRYIVLEDFHYLPLDTQKDFSVALKAFHEESKYCFIIVGVWLEENRLSVYNGDLTGRLTPIDADKWEESELRQAIEAGEAHLNVKFSDEFVGELLKDCFNSIYIVQESCYQCCVTNNVGSTLEQQREIGTKTQAEEIVADVVNQQTGRFNSFITQFADGFQSTTLEMYRWLLYPVLTADVGDLQQGLRLNAITKTLQAKHPNGRELNP